MKQQHRNTFANALLIAIIAVGAVCFVSTVLTWSGGWEISETEE